MTLPLGGAQFVVLPELSDTGYVFSGPAEVRALAAPAADSPTLRRWRCLADELGIVIAGGFCELSAGDRLYNSAALVDGSGTRALYRKAHLWDTEKLIFTPGACRAARGTSAPGVGAGVLLGAGLCDPGGDHLGQRVGLGSAARVDGVPQFAVFRCFGE